MNCLIATLSYGKGSWKHLRRLFEDKMFGKIVLLSTEKSQEWFEDKFRLDDSIREKIEWVICNLEQDGFKLLKETIKVGIPTDCKIYVSIISGRGKGHMALLVALRELNLFYNFVVLTASGDQFFVDIF